jgi:hypothetical protein
MNLARLSLAERVASLIGQGGNEFGRIWVRCVSDLPNLRSIIRAVRGDGNGRLFEVRNEGRR